MLADFLIAELRAARAIRKMNQDEFGKIANYSGSHVSAVETGGRPPTEDYVAAIDEGFQTGGIYSRLLAKVTAFDDAPVWLRPWLEYERDAVALRACNPLLIPGLLQTEAYARAVLETALQGTEEMEKRLTLRLERQRAVFDREDPPLTTFVIGEVALRVGDPKMLAEQLDHLLKLSTRPRVIVHVVPATAGLWLGQSGPFVIASFDGSADVAFLEDHLQGRVVTDPTAIAALQRSWEIVRAVALPRDLSRDLILKLGNEL
ncbi:helix-turn-helix domain-containing protein [Plantactinospora soyae]|uniref:Transcriptional regulator with XRE-family HTH domain n=1 Tax=Plantactinospora soyae TaxID=1544732 RepID=A0A927R3Q6_9ACTN|nr:helix-turn-helix transcriptional regulator [Plantactinospora soyae]MBE1485759.1 transcriptional regulator with XRE-family HTH domain [Plantactinospora soyae]